MRVPLRRFTAGALLCLAALPEGALAAGREVVAPDRAAPVAPTTVHYRTATVDGVSIFYREAGPADGPVLLLLHGFPTSSHMFRNLIPLLADPDRLGPERHHFSGRRRSSLFA